MMTGADIQRVLAKHGVSVTPWPESFNDNVYVRPTLRWIVGPFAYALKQFQHVLETANYAPERNDCDDYARLASVFAQLLHNRTKHKPVNHSALAFGDLYYTHRGGGSHVINVAVVEENDVIFFEPNGCQVIELTDQEKESCRAVRF